MAYEEKWRPVLGYPGYEVSDFGRVRSWRPIRRNAPTPDRPWIKTPTANSRGYLRIGLSQGLGGNSTQFVHRLVMTAFVGPVPRGMQVRHLNGNPADNRLEKLRYGTAKENYADAVRHGTSTRGERQHNATLTRHLVDAIRFAWSLGRFSKKEIADKLDIPLKPTYRVLSERSWRWHPNPWATEATIVGGAR